MQISDNQKMTRDLFSSAMRWKSNTKKAESTSTTKTMLAHAHRSVEKEHSVHKTIWQAMGKLRERESTWSLPTTILTRKNSAARPTLTNKVPWC